MSTILCNNLGAQTGVLYLDTNGGAGTGINPGSSGTILTSTGPNVAPTWLPPAAVVPPYVNVTTGTQAVIANQLYAANFASQVIFTMPATMPQGSIVWFTAVGAGLFQVQLAGGQTIAAVGGITTAGGTLTATAQYQTVSIICTTANTNFEVFFVNGGSVILA